MRTLINFDKILQDKLEFHFIKFYLKNQLSVAVNTDFSSDHESAHSLWRNCIYTSHQTWNGDPGQYPALLC